MGGSRETAANEQLPWHRPPQMRIGIFADSHDHLQHLRLAVEWFNQAGCACVLFAGDLVSTFAVPPLRKLHCPLVGCFGDNEGNKSGLLAGFTLVGQIGEPPVRYVAADGTRFVIAHMARQLRGYREEFDIAVVAHTHRPSITSDDQGRLILNPGETSGWSFQRPTVLLLETTTRQAEIIELKAAPVAVHQEAPSHQVPNAI
jgi:hypothetical protein